MPVLNIDMENLPKVTAPYLPPEIEDDKVYTLVLDLDETLIHYHEDAAMDEPGYVLVRPGALEFLEEMNKYYEIVIFTAAMKDVSVVLLTL
jgi:CTD small phosphatase-like protein 2